MWRRDVIVPRAWFSQVSVREVEGNCVFKLNFHPTHSYMSNEAKAGGSHPAKVVCTFHSLPSKLLLALHESHIIDLIQPTKADLTPAELEEWLKSNIVGASAVVIWIITGRFGERYINAAGPRLREVASYSVGYDHIDVALCQRNGIAVGNTPSCSDDAVADTCLLLMLMVMRRAHEQVQLVQTGKWYENYLGTGHNPLYHNGKTIRGKKVAFYGFGQIAQKLGERLLPLGPCSIAYKTSKASSPFTSLAYPTLHTLSTHCYKST
jgi:glyoxylate/hydroxypyruvate reductase